MSDERDRATTWWSVLSLTEVDGEYLPEDVLISFFRQLVNAGGDTTYRATSVLLTGLPTHPEQFDALRRDRSLIAAAIEEAVRWDGPVLIQTRLVAQDTVLGGVRFRPVQRSMSPRAPPIGTRRALPTPTVSIFSANPRSAISPSQPGRMCASASIWRESK